MTSGATKRTRFTRSDVLDAVRLAGRTHQSIADALGISRAIVGQTLSGARRHPMTQRAIATAVGLDPDRVDWGAE